MDKWEYRLAFAKCDPANWLVADPRPVSETGRESWAVIVSMPLSLAGWTQTVVLVLKRLISTKAK